MNAEHFSFNYTRGNGWGVWGWRSRRLRVRGHCDALCFQSNCAAWTLPAWGLLWDFSGGERGWSYGSQWDLPQSPAASDQVAFWDSNGTGGSLPSISLQFSWENKSEMHKPGINICCVVKTVWFSPSSSSGRGTWPLWASLCCHERCPPNISSSALVEMDNANKPLSK